MLVNAKEFKKSLKNATNFIFKEYENEFSYVFMWTEDKELKVFSMDGHCAYLATFENKDADQIETPIRFSVDDIKQICNVLTNEFLIDFSVTDKTLTMNGKSKIEISIKQDTEIFGMYKRFSQDHLSEEVDYTIPKKGIAIPVQCFAKIFALFKKDNSIRIRCMASKKCVEENAFDDLGVCFIIEHENVKIWCMGMMQSEYISE